MRVMANLVKTCPQGLGDKQAVQRKAGMKIKKKSNKGSRGWQAPKQVRACASTSTVTRTGRRGSAAIQEEFAGLAGSKTGLGSGASAVTRNERRKKNGDPAGVREAGSKQQVGARASAVTRNGRRRSQC